jgi:Ca-activated chloride channel homolog
MNNIFEGITWASWHYYWVVIGLVVATAIFAVWRYAKKRRSARLLTNAATGKSMLLHFSLTKQMIKVLLWILGMSFLGAALLQPQWDKKEEVIEQQGRDLLIALDISRSMLAQDYNPNRLAFAKQKIAQLVSSLSSERVGLILFSDSAFVQCPLTQDVAAFLLFLETVDAETISSGSTALDKAIGKALDVYAAIPHRKNKLLVVFTDGEDFSSNLAGIKQKAQEVGMHIFTVGVGTPEGAPVPIINAEGKRIGHEKDAAGNIVMSRLNEGILRTLADDMQGVYVHASQDNRDVKTIISKVEQYEKEALDDKKISRLEEQYPWFVGASFILFLLEWLL